MNDTKQLPKGLPPLPEGTYYAGTLADFEGRIDCWIFDDIDDNWLRSRWSGMKSDPSDPSASWHVALPLSFDAKFDDGGPAFPSDNFGQPSAQGMSLRDWFAGMALQGMFSNSSMVDTFSAHVTMAQEAYNVADAILAARKEASRE